MEVGRNGSKRSLYLTLPFSSYWQRKLDREYVLYGGAPPDADAESNPNDEVKAAEEDKEEEEDADDEHLTSFSGT